MRTKQGGRKEGRKKGRKSASDADGRHAPQRVGTRLLRKVEGKSNYWTRLTGDGAEGGKVDAEEEGGIIALERKRRGPKRKEMIRGEGTDIRWREGAREEGKGGRGGFTYRRPFNTY